MIFIIFLSISTIFYCLHKTKSVLHVSNDNANELYYYSLNPNANVFISNMNLDTFDVVGCHRSDHFDLNITPSNRSNLNPNAVIFHSVNNPQN